MRRSTSAVAASAFVALFAALAVRCGGGGDITPTPLAVDVVPSASVSGPLPPLIRPECVPTSRPSDGIGPCGCPNDSPHYSDDELAGEWHGEESVAEFRAADAEVFADTYPLWGAGACPCKYDIVAAYRRRQRNTDGEQMSGYLVGKVFDSGGAVMCRYWTYQQADHRVGCGGP